MAVHCYLYNCQIIIAARWWWITPFIPLLGRQKQVDFGEFEDNLVYRGSFRAARVTQGNPVSKTQTEKRKAKKKIITVIFL